MGPAEELAQPSYKWIEQRRIVRNLQGWHISLVPGGIGFSVRAYSREEALRVCLRVEREDGTNEPYLADAYYIGEWGGGYQKWQTRLIPIFPYEGLHGLARAVTFSYGVLVEGAIVPSRYRYRFAVLEDFYRGALSIEDFDDPALKRENEERLFPPDDGACQEAYRRLNATGERFLTPLFTRGDAGRPDHPIRAVHRGIDEVIGQEAGSSGRSVSLAMFDFDNENVSKHLVYARENGVDVECIGEWSQVSPMNVSENIGRLRRAGIPVFGVVRNDILRLGVDIASMHTKFILFDDDEVQSGSYNLHFHLWGGNWEGGLAYRSEDAVTIYRAIYRAIRSGARVALDVDPYARHNIYYSFGAYRAGSSFFRPQDAIVTEIEDATHSIVVCMFDMSPIRGVSLSTGKETDVIGALIDARDRGLRVRVIVNGMIGRTGQLPEPWDRDKERTRPLKAPLQRLKDAWIEVYQVYYHESVYSPLHHKFAVFDGRTVISGSYNWYEPSLRSDEILTVTRDEAIAQAFLEEAELILRSFRIERG